jgi:PadR family transcriptional regulator, regulatory protein PadR
MKEENRATSASDFRSLSRKERLILKLLLGAAHDLYGLEMVEASAGELKRGTIYVTLQRMQEKGLVDSRPEPRDPPEIGIPRRLYSVSGHGKRVYQADQAARQKLVAIRI